MSEVKIQVVNSVYDAVNDVTVHVAAGTIERINIKRINEDGSPKITHINKGPNAGKTIKSTHRYSILLKEGEDSAWISFGEGEVKNLKYEDQFQIKEGDKYVSLKPGMKIRLPVQVKSYKDREGNERTSTEGKKNKIKITDASGARDVAPQGSQAPQGGSQGAGGATTKVYGEIASVSGSDVIVKTDNGNVTVKLTDEQLSQIQEGGRLAGQRSADGSISAFKAYGPKGAGGTGGSRKGGKDDLPIRLGNALTITDAMFPNAAIVDQQIIVVQVLKAMDTIKAKLREEFKGMDDYAFGARLGQSGILAARHSQEGIDQFIENVETTFRFINATEDLVRKDASPEKAPEPQLEQKPQDTNPQVPVSDDGHLDYTPDVMDFDEDIPFAPVGLQYPNHAIYVL
ncbi:hypothetical protein [Salmonella phage SSBI34]|nr:hypothetical protein [Salmonella phage SSBI34]